MDKREKKKSLFMHIGEKNNMERKSVIGHIAVWVV